MAFTLSEALREVGTERLRQSVIDTLIVENDARRIFSQNVPQVDASRITTGHINASQVEGMTVGRDRLFVRRTPAQLVSMAYPNEPELKEIKSFEEGLLEAGVPKGVAEVNYWQNSNHESLTLEVTIQFRVTSVVDELKLQQGNIPEILRRTGSAIGEQLLDKVASTLPMPYIGDKIVLPASCFRGMNLRIGDFQL